MERILLRDGTPVEAGVNGKLLAGQSSSVLLAPSVSMSLAEHLAGSMMIDVERDTQSIWKR